LIDDILNANTTGVTSNNDLGSLAEKYKFSVITADSFVSSNTLFSPFFGHIAKLVYHGLKNLGFDVEISNKLFQKNRIPIVFGAHILQDNATLPTDAIIFNSEQYDSPWFTNDYIKLLQNHFVLDYSYNNIENLKKLGIDGHIVNLGYVKEEDLHLDDSPMEEKDIDVLFYGSINQRRQLLIDLLAVEDINTHVVNNVFGEDLDKLISRSKIILNIHFYEAKILEIVRLNYLLTNGICIVSEDGNDPIEKKYSEIIDFASYDAIPETVMNILRNKDRLQEQRNSIRSFMANNTQESLLAKDFLPYLDQIELSPAKMFPTIINIGSGKDFNKSYLNIDISPETHPDIIYDITQPFKKENLIFETLRFGKVQLSENSIDTIVCNDVLEHLPDLVSAMTTCIKLLKPGGKMKIKVPYDLSYGAWQDPTHVRAFNEESWRYYSDWSWYIGWIDASFKVNSILFDLSPLGLEMNNSGISLDVTKRTPRAVDSMQVELEKLVHPPEVQKLITDFKEHKSN